MVRRVALIGAALLALGGCAGSPVAGDHVGDKAARVALSQVGTPYRYGGKTPAGFDCSGLVHYSYRQAGKSIPRTTTGQWAELAPVASRDMRAGDLLFFSINGNMSHVGLYLGDGKFVHAPSSGRRVEIERLDSAFYRSAFLRAGRP
jgi:cell wall-associated NlpC family hydrolase